MRCRESSDCGKKIGGFEEPSWGAKSNQDRSKMASTKTMEKKESAQMAEKSQQAAATTMDSTGPGSWGGSRGVQTSTQRVESRRVEKKRE